MCLPAALFEFVLFLVCLSILCFVSCVRFRTISGMVSSNSSAVPPRFPSLCEAPMAPMLDLRLQSQVFSVLLLNLPSKF